MLDTPAPLLAAMAVTGACHSFDRKDREDARYWFEAVEQLVFHDLESNLDRKISYRKTQIIQAAFLACIYQTWEGEGTARARIRRSRFNAVVTAARDINMASVRHNISPDFENFDWIDFICMEETIRTLLWVFCLDTAYVIFNNIPPHFALRELRMGLASCEACFQASTSQECFAKLQDWSAHNKRPANFSLYGLIKMFFHDDLHETMLENLAHESFMNLWCVNAAFHVVLFNLDSAVSGDEQFDRIRAGIDNWEAVWHRRLRNNDEHFFDAVVATTMLSPQCDSHIDPWKRPGFWKNAAEYWLLAQLMLERMVSARQSAQAARELSGMHGLHWEVDSHINDLIEDDGMERLHFFLTSAMPASQ
ncbi:hypothetical protein H2198_006512 [Neophaeococcomyces mojaviensis]|uniref:Uncharacterized protein n=1 Tax=Neophaeococcomyces mojaviensis TaxID=3383035 RepID=A0ACC3A2N8_9EURO|nr:hypothetical protein H2198_006512 [Knufia sp. JES_112]